MAIPYTALRNAPRKNLADISPLQAPFTIYLELTNICNFKCSYCPIHFEDYKEVAGGFHSLGDTEIAKIYADIKRLGRLKTLNMYCLGEPFGNRRLPQYIAMAKETGITDRVIVTSNGTLMDAGMAAKIVESGLDYIRFSIYGTDQTEMEAVTGSRIKLRKIVDKIRILRELRDRQGAKSPFIYVKLIDNGESARNQRFTEMFEDLADQVEIESAMNWNEDVNQVDLSSFGPAILDSQYFVNKKAVCPFPFYTMVINADMNVTVCCVDWKKDLVIGNVGDQSLADIWHGERMQEVRLSHLRRRKNELQACRNCTYIHTAPDNIDSLDPDDYLDRLKLARQSAQAIGST